MISLKRLFVLLIAGFLILAPIAGVVQAQTSTDTQTDTTSDYSTYPTAEEIRVVRDEMEGDGSGDNPYVITNVYELQAVKTINQDNSSSISYELGSDIDASYTENWDPDGDGTAEGFNPIGTDSNRFSGYISGQGYEINNLYINRPSENYVGLIGYSESSGFNNMSIVNADISGNEDVGIFAGFSNNNSTINNISVSGTVDGTREVGGLVGRNEGDIDDSVSEAEVTATREVGGLVGYNAGSDASISNSHAIANVEGDYDVGGVVGYNNLYGNINYSYSYSVIGSPMTVNNIDGGGVVGHNEGWIENSYSTANIEAGIESNRIGGIAGYNNGTIIDAYSSSDLRFNGKVGGIVGSNNGGEVAAVYFVGGIEDDADMGGMIIGEYTGGELSDMYYDESKTGYSMIGNRNDTETNNITTNSTALTTSEMQGSNAESNMNLNFGGEWETVENDYPHLLDMDNVENTEEVNVGTPPDDGLSFLQIVIYAGIIVALLAVIWSGIYSRIQGFRDYF